LRWPQRAPAQPERDVVVLFGDCSFALIGFDFITAAGRKLPFIKRLIGQQSFLEPDSFRSGTA
jgi:thiamine pyrophosphate-dependent acetolactate synthase large subunit-like protein